MTPLSHPWSSLERLLIQRSYLTPHIALELNNTQPANTLEWLNRLIDHPSHMVTTDIVAMIQSQVSGFARASHHEIETALHTDKSHPMTRHIEQSKLFGMVCLSTQPLLIGVINALDTQSLQKLKFAASQPFDWRILSLTDYQQIQSQSSTKVERFSAPTAQPKPSPLSSSKTIADSRTNDDAPMVRYIHDLMYQMVEQRASDIHFEPFANDYRIRARIDGVLHDIAHPDVALKEQISVRLKVMAQMDIAEKRIPQDGRIKLTHDVLGHIDCRVSTMPTLFGEKIVVRFLNNIDVDLDIDCLGYEPSQKAALDHALTHPHGLILMTGPTGSGKTVSLYACLNQLNQPHINISSVEDPVEIFMHGVNQVSINEKAGISFATVLRAFLRQDPDILMIGEIRDLETADIALKAAQTGHLVFSTLHTNDAPLALTRLAQMGVTPYNIAASVNLVIAQRLVRKLCDCKASVRIDPHILLSAGFNAQEAQQSDWQFYEAVGCPKCHQTGYLGRIGIFQVLPISSDMQSLIAQNAPAQQLREQAAAENILTLRQAGLLKVKAGLTTLKEIMAATL